MYFNARSKRKCKLNKITYKKDYKLQTTTDLAELSLKLNLEKSLDIVVIS
jgi:hypothetical protein